MIFARIWQYVTAVVGYWQFWVAIAFMLERSLERYFPDLTAPLNERFPLNRRRRIFVGIALIAFVYANFRAFDDVQTKLDAIRDQPSESRWPALTANEAAALKSKLKALPSQDFVVACETVNCRDLADGIASVLSQSGWKVTVLHRGGLDITGVVGIRLEPDEPQTRALKAAIEAATKLEIEIADETRAQRGTYPASLVVGTKPF